MAWNAAAWNAKLAQNGCMVLNIALKAHLNAMAPKGAITGNVY